MAKFYSWDDVVEKDGSEFLVLPEGDYDFEVTEFERGSCASGKYQGAKMAKLTLKVSGEEGTANVFENIILADAFEWKITAFFRAIGAKKRGEKLVMDWSSVTGSKGRAHFTVEEYKGDNRNRVDKYFDKPEGKSAKPAKKAEAQPAEDEDLPF